MNVIRWFGVAGIAGAVVGSLVGGCGGGAVPARAQTDAVAAVRSARELGSENTPSAALELAVADEELSQGTQLIRQGRMDQAERLLVRARADAELAMALRREAQARAEAQESREHIGDLREGQQIGMDGR